MSCFTQILSKGFCVISVFPRDIQLEAQKLVGSKSCLNEWLLLLQLLTGFLCERAESLFLCRGLCGFKKDPEFFDTLLERWSSIPLLGWTLF